MDIDSDLKQAQVEKNEITVSALRNLKAEIKNVAIEKQRELSEAEVLEVVRKKVKQHKDSIEGFTKGGRSDLVEREQKQMEVLQKYLPAQMEEPEVRDLVKKTIGELNAKAADFGKVMKEVLTRSNGRTDGSIVSKLVKEELK
jgi:uncharacterized protein YqeY